MIARFLQQIDSVFDQRYFLKRRRQNIWLRVLHYTAYLILLIQILYNKHYEVYGPYYLLISAIFILVFQTIVKPNKVNTDKAGFKEPEKKVNHFSKFGWLLFLLCVSLYIVLFKDIIEFGVDDWLENNIFYLIVILIVLVIASYKIQIEEQAIVAINENQLIFRKNDIEYFDTIINFKEIRLSEKFVAVTSIENRVDYLYFFDFEKESLLKLKMFFKQHIPNIVVKIVEEKNAP
ncbi:hypothetical protein AAT17_11090 [Nonlabens sp. MIC269]|nr:hypothetical protein AAT17_11090 [Nonlabens sp. MIC269]